MSSRNKSWKKAVFALLLSPLCLAAVASADSTPDGTVKEIVGKMKSQGNPGAIVEYVNWDKAFEQFPEQQKQQLNIKSADDMKGFFREMLEHPSAIMRKQMEARLSTVPPDKQEEAKASIEQLAAAMQKKEEELKDRLVNTKYEVGAPRIDGDTAVVKLTQTYKDQTKVEDVKLEKDGDHWMLPNVNLTPPAKNPAAATPAPGAAPVPPATDSKAPDAK
jgi:hypothetical protein